MLSLNAPVRQWGAGSSPASQHPAYGAPRLRGRHLLRTGPCLLLPPVAPRPAPAPCQYKPARKCPLLGHPPQTLPLLLAADNPTRKNPAHPTPPLPCIPSGAMRISPFPCLVPVVPQ